MVFRKALFTLTASMLAISCISGGAEAKKAPKQIQNSKPQPMTAAEKKQGAEAHPQILAEFGGSYQSPQTAYVVSVAKGIALQTGLGANENDFTVTFLNSSVNNAFALPGGYIYITRQLAGLCNSEAEMAGVLAHEYAHTVLRHSKKRQKRSTIANILGAVGTIGGSILGNSGGIAGLLGKAAKQYSGTLAQIFSLSYSRGQEEEADDYGIKYISGAGYDPLALSDMLTSLAMQTAVDTRAAGRETGSVPEWASTHPDPIKRVARAAANGRLYPASMVRRQDRHFAAINNMLYDDDPKQGVIEGDSFIHPDLRLRFAAPAGYGMQNSTEAVLINGNGGRALFTTAAYSGNKQAYIDAAFKKIGGETKLTYGQYQETTVNGIPAFYATALVPDNKGGQTALTIFAYAFSGTQAYHFATLTQSNVRPFDGMYQSVRRISDNEAAAVKPRKIAIYTVGKNETISSVASRMAYNNLQVERFMALNGLNANTGLAQGRKVKIVTY
jgi:predicted Zn-dependent protease